MNKRIATIAVTALVCLPLGIVIGVVTQSKQSFRYQTLESSVGTERGFGHLTGFFRDESEWRGGISKTDCRNKSEWFAFYNHDGEREGPFIYYWPEENISEVRHYRHGKIHGQCITFSRNGNIESMAYYDNGKLIKESHFRNLEPSVARSEFYANIEKANLQFQEESMADFLSALPSDSIIRKTQEK